MHGSATQGLQRWNLQSRLLRIYPTADRDWIRCYHRRTAAVTELELSLLVGVESFMLMIIHC
eukprot:5052455-Pleurochrysis_carterae.AAC.1